MNLIFTADLHIKPRTWGSIPSLSGDAYHSLRQIADLCLAHQAALVIGGDIFDTPRPSAADAEQFGLMVDRIASEGLPVGVIQGNHDFADPPWPTVLNPQLTHLEKKLTYPWTNFGIYGLDARNPADLENALSFVPKEAKAVILHQLCKEVFPLGWNFSLEWVPPHVTHVWIGDYHERIDQMFERTDGPPVRLLSPGSTHVTNIRDPWEKSVFLIQRSADLPLDDSANSDADGIVVTPIPLRTRPYHACVVNEEADLDRLVERFQELPVGDPSDPLRFPVFVVDYRTDVPYVESRLQAALGDAGSRKGYLWLRPTVIKAVIGSEEEAPIEETADVADCLAEFASPGTELHSLCADLLNAEQTAPVFERWRKSVGIENV